MSGLSTFSISYLCYDGRAFAHVFMYGSIESDERSTITCAAHGVCFMWCMMAPNNLHLHRPPTNHPSERSFIGVTAFIAQGVRWLPSAVKYTGAKNNVGALA